MRFFLCLLVPMSIFSVVTCQFQGRLGNQLFQIAATMALAEELGTQAVFYVNTSSCGVRDYYQSVYPRIPVSNKRLLFKLFKEKSPHYSPIPLKDGVRLKGYFESERHFKKHKEKILPYFQPSEEIVQKLLRRHSNIFSHPNTVSVHLRCYFHEGGAVATQCAALSKDYFLKAMDLFPEDTLFVFFSDDINLCKRLFSAEEKNVCFIEGQTISEDFFMMSLCNHNIISNSTFSWWSAYLNKNLGKIVVAPNYWNGKYNEYEIADDIIPEEWIRVDFDREHPILG